jgi:hypothetical protein
MDSLDFQRLKRYQPQLSEAAYSLFQPMVVLSSTARAFKRYLAEHHSGEELDLVCIYKMPLSSDQFLAVTQKSDGGQNLFFVVD